jgi:hypothetical protein
MSKDVQILTRRIQLFIDSNDKELIGQTYKTLYEWRHICFRAANYIFTHFFLQDQVKELFYLTDETKVKLADITKDVDGILTTSRMNTTYQVLSKNFKGEIPMHILGSLNMTLATTFNYERLAYMKGEKSVRNYKKDIPIPFRGTDIANLSPTENGKNFRFTLFKIPFRTYLGKDFFDKRMLLDNAMKGSVKICTSSIVLDKGKIFLLAAFQQENEHMDLDGGIMAEASLSLEYPIIVRIGKRRYVIGDKEEFLHRRLAIQAARQRIQKASMFNRSGHGRKRKTKALAGYQCNEINYITHKLHVYSRRLIDICVKHKAGTLLLINQQEKEDLAKEDDFLLRNWSYYGLKDKIAYKAKKAGITLIVE